MFLKKEEFSSCCIRSKLSSYWNSKMLDDFSDLFVVF